MEPEHLESTYPATTREKEIGKIFADIIQGKSLQLIALPGAGRNYVLNLLAYNRNVRIHHVGEEKQLQYHFVLVNFSEVKNRPLFDTMKFLFLELASSLHERRREEEFLVVDKLFKDALSYQDELVLFQQLKAAIDYLTLEKNLTLTFLFDRFETFVPQATHAFFTNLRSIRTRAKYKFSVVFSTLRPLEDILDPEIFADYYEFVVDNAIYLSFEDPIGLAFRVAHLEKLTQKKVSKEQLHTIVTLTARHGKLTRMALEALLAGNLPEISKETLLKIKGIQGALKELWLFLTPDEQQDMLTLCKNEICPIPNEFLKKVGLIYNEKIAIPLFAAFVADEAKHRPEKSPFIFDETTNTIRRSNVIISDMLTLSELRLFKLLLEKPDTVIDRETIIATVWSDSKTQEGVSEQAIDQLIFRLRKKIEDDPTNPTHIETVKGRGVRFTQ